jgi:hypothetical protein
MAQSFKRFSIDFEISGHIPLGQLLYIAPLGLGEINEVKFYGGIQTRIDGYKDKFHNQNGGSKVRLGKGIIFSRWGERSPDALKVVQGGLSESAGYEGDFISVRNSYEWEAGSYQMNLVATNQTTIIDNQVHTFVFMEIMSHSTGKKLQAGYLAFPGTVLTLNNSLAIFVELYGKPVYVSNTPNITIEFSNVRINEVDQNINSATAYYPIKYPQWASASWLDGKIKLEVGKQFDRTGYQRNENSYFQRIK